MELLAQIDTIPILKDITFWHLLATGSCGVVIKLLNKHIDKTEATLERITDLLNSVVTKNEVQEEKLINHERRIEKLENG